MVKERLLENAISLSEALDLRKIKALNIPIIPKIKSILGNKPLAFKEAIIKVIERNNVNKNRFFFIFKAFIIMSIADKGHRTGAVVKERQINN